MKNFNWSKYSKPIILVAFIVVLSILRPKAFLSLDNFSNVLWSVAVIGIMVSGTIFVFLIGGIDLSIATLCAFSAVIAVTVTHNMGDTPGAVLFLQACLQLCLQVPWQVPFTGLSSRRSRSRHSW